MAAAETAAKKELSMAALNQTYPVPSHEQVWRGAEPRSQGPQTTALVNFDCSASQSKPFVFHLSRVEFPAERDYAPGRLNISVGVKYGNRPQSHRLPLVSNRKALRCRDLGK